MKKTHSLANNTTNEKSINSPRALVVCAQPVCAVRDFLARQQKKKAPPLPSSNAHFRLRPHHALRKPDPRPTPSTPARIKHGMVSGHEDVAQNP